MQGTSFIYRDFSLDTDRRVASFRYTIETDQQPFDLCETLTFPDALPDTQAIAKLLRALHIGLGISYYKAFLPPIITHPYQMDSAEASFWNTVFKHGLGELLYKNKLPAGRLAAFKAQDGTAIDGADTTRWHEEALLGIGGGKDSIVAGELLKQLDIPLKGFVLATGTNKGQSQSVADVMKVDLLAVERRLDQQIIEIGKLPNTYNGHVPISMVFAFVGCVLAAQTGSSYVVVANEASASIPQVTSDNGSVNHQWSKSLDFEKLFQDYIHQNVSNKLHYFSAIRPLTSVAVAKLFATHKPYFEVFTSDNALFKIKQGQREHPRWSIDSPKSLSSYVLLSPWIADDDLLRIFGRNFLNEPLDELFLSLLGETDTPILDCVGTPDELRLSLSLLDRQGRAGNSHLMQLAKDKHLLAPDVDAELARVLEPATDHALPDTLTNTLLDHIRKDLA